MSTRDRALDGLRGLAIVLVLALHALHLEPVRPAWRWVNAALGSGWIGVDLFFVLSGFLITRILIANRSSPGRQRQFYLRRALRILPAYYAYLLLVLVALWWLPTEPRPLHTFEAQLPTLLLFGQNLHWLAPVPGLRELEHLWSLAVEEQFYLLWPWLAWRLSPMQLLRVSGLLILVAWTLKLLMVAASASAQTIYVLPFTRMDGFAVGAYLAAHQALGRTTLPDWLRPLPGLALGLLLALFLWQQGLPHRSAGHTALYTSATVLMFGGLLQAALSSPQQGWLRRALGQPGLVFFGRYSYELYLLHFGIDTWLRLYLMPGLQPAISGNALMVLTAATGLALSIPLAMLLHHGVAALNRNWATRPGGSRAAPAVPGQGLS